MEPIQPRIEESWKEMLNHEFMKPYFIALKSFLVEEKKKFNVFPAGGSIFRAFDSVPFHKTKALILGQDPYHGSGQANGLCFSVNPGIPLPPSLQNIYKEIQTDIGHKPNSMGDLSSWASQGVLLLNTVLTVRENQPESHKGKGWETFTDQVIRLLSTHRQHMVFILWGNNAKAKIPFIDQNKHLILTAAHPSPLSASRGFFGCRHFSKTNEYLSQHQIEPIDWTI